MMELDIPVVHVEYEGQFGEASFRMMRLDQMQAPVTDNKFFKLNWLMNNPSITAGTTLVSCGGPYSNHLLALSQMAAHLGCQSIGFVRGSHFITNPILDLCRDNGMSIELVPSNEFAPGNIETLAGRNSKWRWIPMGGSSIEGMRGLQFLVSHVPEDVTKIHLPVGTGGTIAGLAATYKGELVGYEVVREGSYTDLKVVSSLLQQQETVRWVHDSDWGRFGKVSGDLLRFARDWFQQTGIPLDMNYNVKMVQSLVKQGLKSYTELVVNTGGLQGNLGHEAILGEEIYPAFSKQSC